MTTKLYASEVALEQALDPQTTVAIVGSGMMGVGIAQLAAVAGHRH
jgi:threonine dehydrogenase-like Zn-dependent dehydrogenase